MEFKNLNEKQPHMAYKEHYEFYRLRLMTNIWVMEGFRPNVGWVLVSCLVDDLK